MLLKLVLIFRQLPQATEQRLVDDALVDDLLLDERFWAGIAAATLALRQPYLCFVEACVLIEDEVEEKEEEAEKEGVMLAEGQLFEAVMVFCSNEDWFRELLVYVGCVDEQAVVHRTH